MIVTTEKVYTLALQIQPLRSDIATILEILIMNVVYMYVYPRVVVVGLCQTLQEKWESIT